MTSYELFPFLTLVFLAIFLLMFVLKRESIWTGFIFNNFLLFLGLTIIVFALIFNHKFLSLLAFIFGIMFIFILLFGLYIVVFALFWNARIVRKKEGDSFANRLTFYAGLGIIFSFVFLPRFRKTLPVNWWFIEALISIYYFTISYFTFFFINFLTTVYLYQLIPPRKNKDFIIVLGSGLRNGIEVTPLLASRIDGALKFHKKQLKKGQKSYLIFSGGQGEDELIPEGLAMYRYALNQGLDPDLCFAETKSTTTLENLSYSKEIMDDLFGSSNYRCAISSNNYHVFRAAHFAKKIGLNAQGIGTPTASYFLPNALIREFVGFVSLNPITHFLFLMLFYVLILIVTYIGYKNPII